MDLWLRIQNTKDTIAFFFAAVWIACYLPDEWSQDATWTQSFVLPVVLTAALVDTAMAVAILAVAVPQRSNWRLFRDAKDVAGAVGLWSLYFVLSHWDERVPIAKTFRDLFVFGLLLCDGFIVASIVASLVAPPLSEVKAPQCKAAHIYSVPARLEC
jgi:hypothetical protein